MIRGRVLHGWKYESMEEKVKSFLQLSPAQRYIQMVEFAGFLLALRKDEIELNDWKPYQDIQILKPKARQVSRHRGARR